MRRREKLQRDRGKQFKRSREEILQKYLVERAGRMLKSIKEKQHHSKDQGSLIPKIGISNTILDLKKLYQGKDKDREN